MSGRRPVVEDPSDHSYSNNDDQQDYHQQDGSRKSQSQSQQRRPSMEMNVNLSKKAVRRESARRSSGRVMLYNGPDADNGVENGGRQDTHSNFWVNDDDKKKKSKSKKNKKKSTTTNDDNDEDPLDDDVKVIWVEDPDHRSISSAEERRQQMYHKIVKGLILCSAIIVCILVIVITAILINRYVIQEDTRTNADAIDEFGDPLDKFSPLSSADGNDNNNENPNNDEDEFICDRDLNGGRQQSGNEVLVATTLDREINMDDAEEETVQYQCTFRNLWTEQRHSPMAFPATGARWEGGPIVWTHNGGPSFQPFVEDSTSSSGVQSMIQNGQTNSLVEELNQQQQQQQVLDWKESSTQSFPISASNSNAPYFIHLPPIQASPQFSHLTMMAVMKPASNENDWFTGFYNFQLIGEDNENIRPQWEDHFVIQTYPWELISSTGMTQRFNNNENNDVTLPAVAELECYIIRNAEDKTPTTTASWIPLPTTCDYFIDPCCQQGGRCNTLLPNGKETPDISCAVQEVLFYQQ